LRVRGSDNGTEFTVASKIPWFYADPLYFCRFGTITLPSADISKLILTHHSPAQTFLKIFCDKIFFDSFQNYYKFSFLGVFVKLQKATIGFVMSVRPFVCPSVRMEQLGSHWTGFLSNWMFFENPSGKSKFH